MEDQKDQQNLFIKYEVPRLESHIYASERPEDVPYILKNHANHIIIIERAVNQHAKLLNSIKYIKKGESDSSGTCISISAFIILLMILTSVVLSIIAIIRSSK